MSQEIEIMRGAAAVLADQSPAAKLLSEASLAGLERMHEVVQWPVDETDLKKTRLIVDTAAIVNRLFVRVAEGEFQQRRDDRVLQLLEALADQPKP